MPKTAREIILETVEYYEADPSRRGMGPGGCMYLTPDGKMCAVGRCMKPEVLQDIVTNEQQFSPISGLTSTPDELLQEDYQGQNLIFWSSLQTYHDSSNYWTDNNAEHNRKIRVEDMLKRYAN